MKLRLLWPVVGCLVWPLWAGQGEPKKAVFAAKGQGVFIELEQVLEAAHPQLENLELERLRFEAEQLKKRHQILQEKTRELVGQRVLELEASLRRMDPQQLFRQIDASVPEPTQEEIDQVWENNKDRIKDPKEQVEPQIRQYLKRQKSQQAFADFVSSLVEKFDVKYLLEPLRFEVAADGFPALGPADAPVTIVEFSDFECPYCAKVGPTLKQVLDHYGDQVRLVFRHYPLTSVHKQAQEAAEAALCAAEQGKFWEMHDSLFADQKDLSVGRLKATAGTLGLDQDAFSQCLDSNRQAEAVVTDVRAAMKAGVSGTPAFFINGRPVTGAVGFEKLAEIIDEELAAAKR
jgi:protein-disulfide isomerase